MLSFDTEQDVDCTFQRYVRYCLVTVAREIRLGAQDQWAHLGHTPLPIVQPR